MTIPSRPAPPPPQQNISQQNGGGQHHITIKLPPPPTGNHSRHIKTTTTASNFPTTRTRYAPTTDWDDTPFDESKNMKKSPPPRPPPPKVLPGSSKMLKKPGPPQSVNMLSNLFGKKKYTAPRKPFPPKIPVLPSQMPIIQNKSRTSDVQLISFDSPPSSPTLTQKSNSDCVSIDSFSSDSNFSSPHNGSVSQPESGFEDDFTSPSDPWESLQNDHYTDIGTISDVRNVHPVRNLNVMNSNQTDDPLNNGKSLLPPQTALTMPTIIRPKVPQNSNISLIPITNKNLTLEMKQTSVFQNNSEDFFNDSFTLSLPMPNCPPPPPPPEANIYLTDVLGCTNIIDTEKESHESSYGISLYDFEGLEDGDLSFKANEKVYILERLNDEWYMGRNKRGCEGMFPSNYIEVKIPLNSNKNMSNDNANSKQVNLLKKIKVLYNFEPETAEDLPLKENDLVTILYQINEDWLYGEVNNRRGQFPANFIEYIPSNLPQNMP